MPMVLASGIGRAHAAGDGAGSGRLRATARLARTGSGEASLAVPTGRGATETAPRGEAVFRDDDSGGNQAELGEGIGEVADLAFQATPDLRRHYARRRLPVSGGNATGTKQCAGQGRYE